MPSSTGSRSSDPDAEADYLAFLTQLRTLKAVVSAG